MIVVLLALTAGAGTTFEAELSTSLRSQVSGAFVDGVYVFATDFAVTTGGRFRLERDDSRFGLEIHGAGDTLKWIKGERPQRWGGVRAYVGGAGRSPLTRTTGHVRLGTLVFDVRDVAQTTPEALSFVSIGGEVRRFARGRVQMLEGDVMFGRTVWGGELRTRIGVPVGRSGAYVTLGGATSRFMAYDPDDLTQVTWALETSLLFRPTDAKPRRR